MSTRRWRSTSRSRVSSGGSAGSWLPEWTLEFGDEAFRKTLHHPRGCPPALPVRARCTPCDQHRQQENSSGPKKDWRVTRDGLNARRRSARCGADFGPVAPLAGELRFRETRAPPRMYATVIRLRDEPRPCRIHDQKPRFVSVVRAARKAEGDVRRRVPWLDRVTRRQLSCSISHNALATSSISDCLRQRYVQPSTYVLLSTCMPQPCLSETVGRELILVPRAARQAGLSQPEVGSAGVEDSSARSNSLGRGRNLALRSTARLAGRCWIWPLPD